VYYFGSGTPIKLMAKCVVHPMFCTHKSQLDLSPFNSRTAQVSATCFIPAALETKKKKKKKFLRKIIEQIASFEKVQMTVFLGGNR